MARARKKKGPFSQEEDQIILRIIRNWDNNGVSDGDANDAGGSNGFSGDNIGNGNSPEEGGDEDGEGSTKSDSANGARTISTDSTKKEAPRPRTGKWVAVGDALNRPPDCCSQRYRDTLLKRPPPPTIFLC